MTASPTTEQASARRRRRLAVPILLVIVGLFGAIVGLGSYTFIYAKGFAYLSDDPAACVNCHVMREVFDAWNHSSHKAVAVCNDCHMPHNSIVAKYAVKAINGFNHSLAFTTGNFPEPIQITPFNRDIVQQSCLYCHGSVVAMMGHTAGSEPTDCLRCHSRVGHDTR